MANIDPIGIDLSTGQTRSLKLGDSLTDADGSPISGLQGSTGLQGFTGLSFAGSTGLQGFTGFGSQGSTGISGNTGIGTGVTTENVNTTSGATISRSIPGGTLAIDGESLSFQVWGTTGTGNTVTVSFGATTILTMTSLTSSTPLFIQGTIIRTGASAQVIGVTSNFSQTANGTQFVSDTSATETLSGSLTLSAQATAGSGESFSALAIHKWPA